MKATRSIALALMLVSGASFAHPPAVDMNTRWEKMASNLGLDEAQTTTFLSVMNTQHAKRRGYHEEMKSRMTALHEETIKELSATLTSEQLEQFKSAVPPKRHHGRHHGRKHHRQVTEE
jgi:cytochrome c553